MKPNDEWFNLCYGKADKQAQTVTFIKCCQHICNKHSITVGIYVLNIFDSIHIVSAEKWHSREVLKTRGGGGEPVKNTNAEHKLTLLTYFTVRKQTETLDTEKQTNKYRKENKNKVTVKRNVNQTSGTKYWDTKKQV